MQVLKILACLCDLHIDQIIEKYISLKHFLSNIQIHSNKTTSHDLK